MFDYLLAGETCAVELDYVLSSKPTMKKIRTLCTVNSFGRGVQYFKEEELEN